MLLLQLIRSDLFNHSPHLKYTYVWFKYNGFIEAADIISFLKLRNQKQPKDTPMNMNFYMQIAKNVGLKESQKGSNFLFSPVSIHVVLSMVTAEPDLAILLLRPRDGSAGDPPSPPTAATAARSPATLLHGVVAAEIPSDCVACDFCTMTRRRHAAGISLLFRRSVPTISTLTAPEPKPPPSVVFFHYGSGARAGSGRRRFRRLTWAANNNVENRSDLNDSSLESSECQNGTVDGPVDEQKVSGDSLAVSDSNGTMKEKFELIKNLQIGLKEGAAP
ncbi:hypothetical protein MRB53_025766 [Persea americana]|uniref:Uncharacterized protein n=1 Tax=Persea americana TaxID=3435 RepID=A0ACC2LG32_PERAE|nr:hypothetical protein MRB53_025766 [Persea americana]